MRRLAAVLAMVVVAGCGGSEAEDCQANGGCFDTSATEATCWWRPTIHDLAASHDGKTPCLLIGGASGTMQHPLCSSGGAVTFQRYECR